MKIELFSYFIIELSNIWRILGFGGGNVLVNYPRPALRNQSMAFSKQPISRNQLSQIV